MVSSRSKLKCKQQQQLNLNVQRKRKTFYYNEAIIYTCNHFVLFYEQMQS